MILMKGRRAVIAAACTIVIGLVALAASAMASGSTLTVEVKGEYAKVHRIACQKNKPNWRAFHRASTLEVRGYLLPAPATHFQVRVKIEKCVRGQWKAVHDYYLVGEDTSDPHPGRFKAYYPVRRYAPKAGRHHRLRVSYYRAKAYVGTLFSNEQYFFVNSR
jgi:hypothetical protein